MATKTGIEWTDYTINFTEWQCDKVSPGCKNCYAAALAARFGKDFSTRDGLRERFDAAEKALKKLPRGAAVFVNSMSDFAHEKAPRAWLERILDNARQHPDKTFLLLTKRIDRPDLLELAYPENVWLGTSVENSDYLWRLDYLIKLPVKRFVSAEPLLGELMGLKAYIRQLQTVIVGAESGDKRRPFNPVWARQIRDICGDASVPFMFKQGSHRLPGQNRLLDGRLHNAVGWRTS